MRNYRETVSTRLQRFALTLHTARPSNSLVFQAHQAKSYAATAKPAVAEFPLKQAIVGRDVEVEWMPFELRPEPHPTLRPEGEYLQRAWSQSV